jgi:hypothetical protein
MSTTTADKGPFQLAFQSGHVVVPENGDRLQPLMRQLNSACGKAVTSGISASQNELRLLGVLSQVRMWCDAHERLARGCYLPSSTTGNCIKIYVVARSDKFDFELSDCIADLESKLFDDGWNCDILQIAAGSEEQLSSFFDVDRSLQIY